MDHTQQARELLPCPFCGGEATLRMIGNVHSTRKCVVKCSGCRYERTDAALRYGDEWLLKTAIAAWNRRSAMRAAPESGVPERTMMALATGWRRHAAAGGRGRAVLIQCAESLEAAVIAARPQGVK